MSHILCALDLITAPKFYQNTIKFVSISITGFFFQGNLDMFLKMQLAKFIPGTEN